VCQGLGNLEFIEVQLARRLVRCFTHSGHGNYIISCRTSFSSLHITISPVTTAADYTTWTRFFQCCSVLVDCTTVRKRGSPSTTAIALANTEKPFAGNACFVAYRQLFVTALARSCACSRRCLSFIQGQRTTRSKNNWKLTPPELRPENAPEFMAWLRLWNQIRQHVHYTVGPSTSLA